jgi:FkbM family methyltransferase
MAGAEKSQESWIWQYFGCRDAGFFVEVGANHPTAGSLTWFFEQRGWNGILIEPQERLFELCRRLRPRSKVFQAACTAPEKTGYAQLHVPSQALNGFATLQPNVDDLDIEYETVERVRSATLDALLAQAGQPKIDFISIDTEGTELDVLRGFDLQRHQPALLLVEDKGHSLAKHRHLRAHGYRLVKRTELNNWYIPVDADFHMTNFWERLCLWRKVFLGLPGRKLRHWRHTIRRSHSRAVGMAGSPPGGAP